MTVIHEWMCADDGSYSEIDLEPGRYKLSAGATVARPLYQPPPQREDHPEICDLDWPAIADQPPIVTLLRVRIAPDGSFRVPAGRGGLHRIIRPAGLSQLMQV